MPFLKQLMDFECGLEHCKWPPGFGHCIVLLVRFRDKRNSAHPPPVRNVSQSCACLHDVSKSSSRKPVKMVMQNWFDAICSGSFVVSKFLESCLQHTLMDRLNWTLDSYKNDLRFDQLPFLSLLRYKGVTYLFRNPKAILNESSNQSWKSSIHSVQKLALTKSGTFSLQSLLSHCG